MLMEMTITSQQMCGNFQQPLLNYLNSVACNYQIVLSVSDCCTASHWTSLCLCCFPSGACEHTATQNSLHSIKHLMKIIWEDDTTKMGVLMCSHCNVTFGGQNGEIWGEEQKCQRRDSCQYNHFQIALLSKIKQVIFKNHSSHREVSAIAMLRILRLLHCYVAAHGAFSFVHVGPMDDSALKGRVHHFIRNLRKRLYLMAVPLCHLQLINCRMCRSG